MKRIITAIALIALIASCKEPLSKQQTNNTEYEVNLLFEHDGCKVYRFYDNGYRYFVVGPNKSSLSWDVQEGKNNRVSYEIQTVTH